MFCEDVNGNEEDCGGSFPEFPYPICEPSHHDFINSIVYEKDSAIYNRIDFTPHQKEDKELNNDELVSITAKVYPNPSIGIYSVNMQNADNFNFLNYNVLKTNGQILLRSSIIYDKSFNIDLYDYPSGIYILQININDNVLISKKLIKI